MTVRQATEADLDAIGALWRAFQEEIPEPEWSDVDVDEELAEIAEIVRGEVALLAEQDGAPVGFALARRRGSRLGRLTDLYVVPDARAAAASRTRSCARPCGCCASGAWSGSTSRSSRRTRTRAPCTPAGTRAPARPRRAARGARGPPRRAPAGRSSFGSIHVQADDVPAVERAVRQFVPRLPGGSRGSIVARPRNGWIAVYDDVTDRDPAQLRRLARELSDRMGAVTLAIGVEEAAVVRFVLHEYGRIVDEYLSVQEYFGPLPPGDVIALQANARVVARLTGAEPAAVRAAAVHAATPAELPPPVEILTALAAAMGIEGAGHGWADAPICPTRSGSSGGECRAQARITIRLGTLVIVKPSIVAARQRTAAGSPAVLLDRANRRPRDERVAARSQPGRRDAVDAPAARGPARDDSPPRANLHADVREDVGQVAEAAREGHASRAAVEGRPHRQVRPRNVERLRLEGRCLRRSASPSRRCTA